MSRKKFGHRRRLSLFQIVFLISLTALFCFNALAQSAAEEQNQPKEKETEKCKGEVVLCMRIESLTKEIAAEQKRSSTNYSNSYYRRAELYLEKGDIAAALSDVNRYLKKESSSPNALLLRGKIYNRLARFDEAIKDFDAVIKSDYADRTVFYGRGFAYYHKREYDLALDDFNNAIRLDSRLSAAYYYRALILTMQGKTLISEENFAQATENYQKAVEDFTTIIEIDLRKTNPKVYLLRSKLYEALGETEKAAADRKAYEELVEKP